MRPCCLLVLAGLLMLSSCSRVPAEGRDWQTLEHAGGTVLLDCPSNWTFERKDHFLLIESPMGEEAITLSTFFQRGKTLDDFSQTRFEVEQEIYKPIGEAEELNTDTSVGLTLLSQGVYPGDKEETTRYMFCICDSSVCASVSVYTSPENFLRQKSVYDLVFKSLKFRSNQ